MRFAIALAFRLINALLSRSFFQPDEYWQALEPAHALVFRYGYATWEWRTTPDTQGGIRSPLYPLLFVPVYWLLKVTGADATQLLVIAPRLVQAVIAAGADVATARLAARLFSPAVANTALFCSLVSFFNFHAATRTFSNSTETALTAAALALWPWDGVTATNYSKSRSKGSLVGALALGSLASILRPSNLVIWIILGLRLLISSSSFRQRSIIVLTALGVSAIAGSVCFLVDTLFYGTPTFTPYNFLRINVFQSIALFYGANPVHFYVTQALPFLTLFMLPFVLHGLFSAPRTPRIVSSLLVLAGTTGTYSLLSHKEFRFVHPLLPLLHAFAAYSLTTPHLTRFKPLLVLSLVPAIYLTTFHAVGQVAIMNILRGLSQKGELASVAFLMPCHSTPWMSHLHAERLVRDTWGRSGEGGRAWFITCEPPILGQDPTTYKDQSDFFYASIFSYLLNRFPPLVDPSFPPSLFPSRSPNLTTLNDLNWTHVWPSHLVIFEALLKEEGVQRLLRDRGYVEERRLWNSHWHEDERRRGDVVLLKWGGGEDIEGKAGG